MAHACNPNSGKVEVGDPWTSWLDISGYLSISMPVRDPVPKEKQGKHSRRVELGDNCYSDLHMYVYPPSSGSMSGSFNSALPLLADVVVDFTHLSFNFPQTIENTTDLCHDHPE